MSYKPSLRYPKRNGYNFIYLEKRDSFSAMDNNNIKTSLAFFVTTFGLATAFTTTVQRGMAASSSDAGNFTNAFNPVTLGNPYFVEYDKTTSQKPTVIN